MVQARTALQAKIAGAADKVNTDKPSVVSYLLLSFSLNDCLLPPNFFPINDSTRTVLVFNLSNDPVGFLARQSC
jgi:hypothetical protein